MRTVHLGHTDVTVTRLGLGCASIGNLYRAMSDEVATDTVQAAWEAGVRYFDTAPHYGLGLSERRLGAALRPYPREQYTVSTKVGRVLEPDPGGAATPDPDVFAVPADHRRRWDFSRDGVRRSLDDSLDRLGLDRVDLVLLHDPEDHLEQALDAGYPALAELRAAGVVGAIGVGSTRADVAHRVVTAVDIDAVLVAGRYTLLEQPAMEEFLPACLSRGVAVLNAGVFNSGLLAVDAPHADLPYDYRTVPPAVLHRAQRIAAVCARHATPLPAAAIAFAAAHPAVTSVLVGAESPQQVLANAAALAAPPPPPGLWQELIAAGLLRPDVPLPVGHP